MRNLNANLWLYRAIFSLTALLLLLFMGCQSDKRPQGADISGPLLEGRWRAVLNLDEEIDPAAKLELPFNFDVVKTDAGYEVYFINGPEKIKSDDVLIERDSLFIQMPYFNSEIKAKINERRILGAWYNYDKGTNYQLPLYAVWGDSTRFFLPTLDTVIQVEGNWEVLFMSDDKSNKTDAIGSFRQNGSFVNGTFITPSGDYRYLEGIATDHELMLSCFDGAHAYLFVAGITNAGDLQGDAWYGKHSRETWLAFKNDTVMLPLEGYLSSAKTDVFHFNFPNLDGKMISDKDEQFKNKVVIVQIMGSWCPNCLDETRLLVDLYQKYHNRGLEIVALSFERSSDLTTSGPLLARYIKQLNVPYPVLLAGEADKQKASAVLPDLDELKAFPTTIFIDRQGKVRNVQTGFSGPATYEYAPYLQDLTVFLNSLLDEKSS